MLAETHPRGRAAARVVCLIVAGAMLAGCGINTIPDPAGAGQGGLEPGA